MSDLGAFIECKVRWHRALATASHNELLSTFMEAVSRAILRQTEVEAHRDPEAMQRSLQAHRDITKAIEEHNSALAYRLMTQHVHTPPLIESTADPVAGPDYCNSLPQQHA